MPEFNNWGVPYSMIQFFERALHGHAKVAHYERPNDIHFRITHIDGSVLNVLLVDEYSLGLAAVLRAKSEFPEVDYIVTGGNWNGYTPQAKEYGRNNGLGIFNAGEFFSALHWSNPKEYYRRDENENPVYSYKSYMSSCGI